MTRTALALLSVVALGSPAIAANQVILVAPPGTPGADFSSVQAGIDAAANGDIVLVKNVSDEWATIDGKGIVLARHPASGPVDLLTIRVKNTAAAQCVIVQGVRAQWSGNTIENCAGPVLFQDVVLSKPVSGIPTANPLPMLSISGSAHVSLIGCTVHGESNIQTNQPKAAAPGLRVATSSVTVYRGEVRGGDGSDFLLILVPPVLALAEPGAAAIEFVSGNLLVGGALVRGGEGGFGGMLPDTGACHQNESGGAGIVVGGSLRLLGADVAGGAKGAAHPGCPDSASDGPATWVTTGTVNTIPEPLRSITATGPVALGGTTFVDVVGVPGEPALLIKSSFQHATDVPHMKGLLLPAPPWTILALGAIPPSGTLSLSVPIPSAPLPPGIEGVVQFTQVVVPGASGTGMLSAPTSVTIFE